jgi:hypothetical protein
VAGSGAWGGGRRYGEELRAGGVRGEVGRGDAVVEGEDGRRRRGGRGGGGRARGEAGGAAVGWDRRGKVAEEGGLPRGAARGGGHSAAAPAGVEGLGFGG